ncbi:hypothetical protein VNO78_37465 [Psophocarpus tetragonolobus]|uniref:NADH dehydrogenase subunit 5 C-terminal domain-containing protein n=1 Tax=Psophocarpus tetragonolobus TaxID=3891 RepID=A0AAN9RLK7_PSOTE
MEKNVDRKEVPAVSLALTPMNQIVPYVPPQPSDPLMEKISRLERAVNKLSRDKYDVADLENLSLYPKVRLPYGFQWPKIEKLWIKRVSSHFPESQSYYSTLAKLMMKQDLDLSADDDVHSWLDALNERELSRLRMNFLRASVAYNVNPIADQFQRAFQTSTFCNRLYSFFNKRWFFDQVLNDFLVRSFLRFGYEVSFEALDKGAIEILGPYGISYTFRRLAERISQLQSGFVVRRVRYDPWPPAWSVRPRGCKKIDRGGYLAGVVSVVCHEVPMDKGNHRFWAQAALYHPSHCIPSSRIVLYRTKPDTSIEVMISARAAGRTTIVSPVTTRVEWSQKVWYSSLSERASGISCKPP